MIENYLVDEQTKEVSGVFSGVAFVLPARFENNELVALSSDECNVILTEREVLKQLAQANEYKHAREAEYPPITDYIDGVVKGDQAQIDEYIAACQAVKAKYPKPTE
jgi:hypothetical protein